MEDVYKNTQIWQQNRRRKSKFHLIVKMKTKLKKIIIKKAKNKKWKIKNKQKSNKKQISCKTKEFTYDKILLKVKQTNSLNIHKVINVNPSYNINNF